MKNIDRRNKVYTYEYDRRHKPVKETNLPGEFAEHSCRGDGKQTSKTTGGKTRLEYTCDNRGRLWKEKRLDIDVITKLLLNLLGMHI